MKPLSLTMQAFGSYGKKTTIDFTLPTQNLFLITGDTGAGKTTIFDAIVFALYGQASSISNKKDGVELQSQFVSLDTLPFVELTFSEMTGGTEQVYTVHRVPRHIRPAKRKGGSEVKEDRETVSLTMPDGSEYSQNQKETDARLEEIVGLTKEQFMQVAMIAQGEFVELLRAKSTDKKTIFRKLFNTSLFEDIVVELDRRRKEKLTQIGTIRTACQTEAAHIRVPETWPDAEELSAAQYRIIHNDRLNTADMEYLVPTLKRLCEDLNTGVLAAEEKHEQAARLRDARRDALNHATVLAGSFAQLESAERELSECAAAEGTVKEAAALITSIGNAYEIQAVHHRMCDAQKTAEGTARDLKEQQTLLPALTKADTEAAKAEQNSRTAQAEMLQAYSKTAERVTKGLETLEKAAEAKKEYSNAETALNAAQRNMLTAKKALTDFEATEQSWNKEAQVLRDAAVLLAKWETRQQTAQAFTADIAEAQKLAQQVREQREVNGEAQKAYSAARQAFLEKNAEYLKKQNAFLDAQAGFIAREKLVPGEPCPVCGSVDHPHPCTLSDEDQHLTRDMIDALAQEAQALQAAQESASSAAASAGELLTEKSNQFRTAVYQLRSRMAEHLPDLAADAGLGVLEQALLGWQNNLAKEGEALQKDADTLARLQKNLQGAGEAKQKLSSAADTAVQQHMEASARLAGCRSTLDALEQQKDFATKQEALTVLADAEAKKAQADQAYTAAHARAADAKSALEKATTLIQQFSEALPGQQQEFEARRSKYEAILAEKALTEEQWQAVVSAHQKDETTELQKQIDAHNSKKAKAIGARDTALQTIGQQQKPDVEQLTNDKEAAEEALAAEKKVLDSLKAIQQTNRDAYDALAPQMDSRAKIAGEYTRIDSLYTRLAGKVSGARMDIETFVQRYYLQQVLYAANMRFQDMSAGQFELRMVDEDQAGEGKNRGLDLMVYSTVTGKEREVRTLSGGESFMAALSLALGMADQIQANSTAINLDMMFIDEGFGSLDSHSREQAVSVLKQMASGSKLIGIISHVSELQQSIEDQLVVRKDDTGSHPQWIIS